MNHNSPKIWIIFSLQIIDRDKIENKVKIHFIGYSSDFDEWGDGDDLVDREKSSLGRLVPRFIPSEDSLTDRASALFNRLGQKGVTGGSDSLQIDMVIYKAYLKNIG